MIESEIKSAYDMLYLTACILNNIIPDKNKIESMDLESLFKMCQFHSLTCIVCMAMESSETKLPKYWTEAKNKAIRKVILLDVERENIIRYMEKNKIWYMPLKGVILKEYYPMLGMRQMSDNDILYDSKYQKQIKEFMVQNGYQANDIHKVGCHEEYLKPPVYNYEMHIRLFDEITDTFSIYYSDVKRKLLKDDENGFGYHFTNEDFYIYIIAHEYKHYCKGGTGLRSLADIFVYLQAKEDSLDFNYIDIELEKLGIKGFEKKNRELCKKIFRSVNVSDLSDDEIEMLQYYLFSGTYGTTQHRISNNIIKAQKSRKTSKSKYLITRIFPDMNFYKLYYPWAHKYKILIPFAWFFRLFRAVFFKRKEIRFELKIIHKTNVTQTKIEEENGIIRICKDK